MKIGAIGGSGLDDPDIIKDLQSSTRKTPYGETTIKSGRLNDVEIVFVPRHGSNHQFSPTHVNYRANIQALKDLNVTHIIATNACGSLKKEIDRGDFIIPNQFIDCDDNIVEVLVTTISLIFKLKDIITASADVVETITTNSTRE